MERRRKTKTLFILGIILLILFCVFFFRVKKVSVEGNTYYSEAKMAEMFQTSIFEKNVLSFWVMDKFSLTPKLDFVREYEATYPTVNEVHIKLYEKTVVAGIAYTNQYIYFDKDGMVLQSANEPVKDIPLFETKSLTTFTLYDRVKMEDEDLLKQILNLANLFQHYQVTWDRVRFNKANEAYMYVNKLKIKLGKRDNYDEPVSALASVLEKAQKQNMEGEIDLSAYDVDGTIILHTTEKK